MSKFLMVMFLTALVTLISSLTGCSNKEDVKAKKPFSMAPPKFAYHQEVVVTNGFLKGQVVTITNYEICNKELPVEEQTYCYSVTVKSDDSSWKNLSEQELQ